MGAAVTGKTDYRFKFLYAVGMYLTLAAHTNFQGPELFYDWFPSSAYAMPLFVFCSGYFYKPRSEENMLAYIGRKARALLVPLYLWNLFYALVVVITRHFGFSIGVTPNLTTLLISPLNDGSQFEFNMASWFAASLFMVETSSILLRRLFRISGSRIRECAAVLLYLLLGMLGIWVSQRGAPTGWWLPLVRLLYLLPFYGLGIFYRRVLEQYDRIPDGIYFTILFFAQYLLVIVVGHFPKYTFSRCDNFNDGLLTPFIAAAIGIAFWLRVARTVESTIARDKWVNVVADNSLGIMMNHFMGFMAVKCGFAFLKTFTSHCQDFDMARFKSDIVYYYTPGGRVFIIFYIAAGFIVSLLMQKAAERLKRLLRRKTSAAPTA